METSNHTKREKLIKGLELYYQRLIKHKIERNTDLVVSENGKVVHVNPKKFKK
ncbi:MAG: hypothetical protein K9J21_11580 [Bacteroidales bacterium]|nr:hypothetical protein [Bacteroidales bacterium]